MTAINPYLNFDGNCGEAFDFYKSVFGGEFTMRQTFGQTPPEARMPGVDENHIMHVSLPVGKGNLFMGSDRPPSMGKGTRGDMFTVSLNTDSEKETDRLFNGLSAGGNVTMPLGKTFWGAYFGMWVDKYGIAWMVNYEYPKG